MLTIGLNRNDNRVYEGSSSANGVAVWPSPILSAAKIVSSDAENFRAHDEYNLIGESTLVFREDYFDPFARIRRGRFYNAGNQQPQQWHVQAHPAYPREVHGSGPIRTDLETFYGCPFSIRLEKIHNPVVLLGFKDSFSTWSVLETEQIITGEELVTLKARHSFGALPDLNLDEIPGEFIEAVRSAVEAFADEIHRSGIVSIIDRGRETAVEVLLAYLVDDGWYPKKEGKERRAMDLAALSKVLEKKELYVAANVASTLSILHARAKPAERASRDMPKVVDKDAELAVQCVGTILREIGWAYWR